MELRFGKKLRTFRRRFGDFWKIYRRSPTAVAGLSIIVFFVIFGTVSPFITPHNPYDLIEAAGNPRGLPPNGEFILGTDALGRDVFSQLAYGTWITLLVGFFATFISVVMGTAIGLAAGYFGRFVDEGLMRVTDFFLVIPWLPFLIVLTTLFNDFLPFVSPISVVILVIGVTGWPTSARIVRSQVLTVKERQYIERAKAIGSSSSHIIVKHILPNVVPLVVANSILTIALAIFSESYLDFFGLGDPNVISWGNMIKWAYDKNAFTLGQYWWSIPPGLSIILLILGFSFVGHALDEILNPRLRRR